MLPNADFLVLYSNDVEKHALRAAAAELKLDWIKHKSTATGLIYYDLGTVGYTQVLATRTAMGPHYHLGSSATALTCLAETGASTVVLVGMAFGLDRSTQSLTDVVVATHIVAYDDRDVVSIDGTTRVTYPRLRRHPAREAAVGLLQRAAELRHGGPQVHFGTMLSGAARIHCAEYRDEIMSAMEGVGDLIGGEMEGVGVLSVSKPQDPNWLLVKGISDFADESRDEDVETSKVPACENAANFLLKALLSQRKDGENDG